jgi:prepilin-type N-terminal cleavage/methylation domain-containing protein
MSKHPRLQTRGDSGFTLIEILVVILIIGILTAIAVPSFLSQRSKADDACAKTMVKQMFTAMKTFQTDSGNYLGANLQSLNVIESSVTSNRCGNATGIALADPPSGAPSGACTTGSSLAASSSTVGFCVGAQSNGGSWFSMTEKSGAAVRTCTIPSTQVMPYGGCKGSSGTTGSW